MLDRIDQFPDFDPREHFRLTLRRNELTEAERAAGAIADPDEVGLDHVGSLENAARVIATLHRGEKRLVFADSRARVETLAAHLRKLGVQVFVSHSSLGVDERRRAEQAFAEGSDCVIVATSTLELGIDVGDLDRVIQIDAPATVAAFLQRLGRTGRRPGTSRNCLFLATDDDAFLQAAGLIQLWSEGFVEPVAPPPLPYHVLAQQILALCLQEGGLGRSRWAEWIGRMPGFAAMESARVEALLDHMLEKAILFEDGGALSIGLAGEKAFGGRNHLDLFSVFSSPPLFRVLHGRSELGFVHESSFQARQTGTPVLLLAGRGWAVTHVDWAARTAYVEPTEEIGRSRWVGAGQALHFALCRALRRVLARKACPARLSRRAAGALERLARELFWAEESSTAVVRGPAEGLRWWTFAGLTANLALAECLAPFVGESSRPANLCLTLDPSTRLEDLVAAIDALEVAEDAILAPTPSSEAIDAVKFVECVPRHMAEALLRARLNVALAVRTCLAEPVRGVTVG